MRVLPRMVVVPVVAAPQVTVAKRVVVAVVVVAAAMEVVAVAVVGVAVVAAVVVMVVVAVMRVGKDRGLSFIRCGRQPTQPSCFPHGTLGIASGRSRYTVLIFPSMMDSVSGCMYG